MKGNPCGKNMALTRWRVDKTALGVCSKRAVIRLKCEKSLDEIALAIGLSECPGIVVFVGKNLSSQDVGGKGLGLGVVVGLPWRQDEAQRIAQGIDNGANLGGQPAACWCARTMIESIMTYSKSGSSAIMAKSRSYTPSLDQREKRINALRPFKPPS
jgi:hypothetical protein